MEKQCNHNVIPLLKMANDSDQFSITLPTDAIEMIEEGLIPFGLYGKKRATVCSTLILDMLKRPEIQENIKQGRAKTKG